MRYLFSNPYLLLLLATLLWGANSNAGKLAVGVIDPITLTQLRWFFTALIATIFGFNYLRRDWPVAKQHLALLFVLGCLGFSGFNLSLYGALTYTSVINASIEQASIPLFILVFNFLLFGQRVMALQLLGVILAVAGVVVTVSEGNPAVLLDSGLNRGDAMMIFASFLYASFSVLLRHKPKIHWLSFLAILALSAALATIPFTVWHWGQNGGVPEIGKNAWLLVAFVVIFPSLISQLLYIRGVELLGANRAGLFINMVPVFGSLIAVLVLGESFFAYHAAGLCLVFGGIALAEWCMRKV